MLTAQPFAATPRTDSSVSGSSHSPSLEKKPEASHSVSHSATGPSPGDGCQPGIRRRIALVFLVESSAAGVGESPD